MGLDIVTCMRPVLIASTECDQDANGFCRAHEDDERVRSPYNLAVYADRARDLEPVATQMREGLVLYRCYGVREERRFRAGSYTGYNEWRELLSREALGVAPADVWHDPTSFESSPFYEIINFADNEGVMGPTVCRKLARDFAEWELPRGLPEWFHETYIDFALSFAAASLTGGFVLWR